MDRGNGLLLTGATGFVGKEVLVRLLARTDRTVYALVRAGDRAAAARRVGEAIATSSTPELDWHGRVVPVAGDLERPDLGIGDEARDKLAADVSDILHSAASVSFTLPVERAREINVEGTRNILRFAELCAQSGALRRFSHVSTAYVAGTHAGTFGEGDLDVGQDFHNSYEQSKFEAETLVRRVADRVPIQIFRPSIVVGERSTGWTSAFNVLYVPLKAFARGALRVLPAKRDAPVDVVPVDFVADAVVELVERPGGERVATHHLVSGPDASTVGRLMELSARHLNRPAPATLPPRVFARAALPVLKRLGSGSVRRAAVRCEAFFPYFATRAAFDDQGTRTRLRRAGIEVSSVEQYLPRLIDFAIRADWGRRPRAKHGRLHARR